MTTSTSTSWTTISKKTFIQEIDNGEYTLSNIKNVCIWHIFSKCDKECNKYHLDTSKPIFKSIKNCCRNSVSIFKVNSPKVLSTLSSAFNVDKRRISSYICIALYIGRHCNKQSKTIKINNEIYEVCYEQTDNRLKVFFHYDIKINIMNKNVSLTPVSIYKDRTVLPQAPIIEQEIDSSNVELFPTLSLTKQSTDTLSVWDSINLTSVKNDINLKYSNGYKHKVTSSRSKKKSIISTEESKVSTEESKVSTEESKVSTEDSKVSTEESKVSTEESKVSTEESKVSTEESLVLDNQVSSDEEVSEYLEIDDSHINNKLIQLYNHQAMYNLKTNAEMTDDKKLEYIFNLSNKTNSELIDILHILCKSNTILHNNNQYMKDSITYYKLDKIMGDSIDNIYDDIDRDSNVSYESDD
jgi:hypothetical protein